MPSWRQRSITPSGRCRLPTTASRPEALLGLGQVVHGDRPAQPAAAALRAGPDRLPERRLVRRGVVQDLDDLDVALVPQREDDVAGAEPRVDPTIDGFHADLLRQALGGRLQPVALGCI